MGDIWLFNHTNVIFKIKLLQHSISLSVNMHEFLIFFLTFSHRILRNFTTIGLINISLARENVFETQRLTENTFSDNCH